MTDAPAAPSGHIPVLTSDSPVYKAGQDVYALFDELLNHESSGAYAAILLSGLLTAYVWYRYGPTAGAPLAASFFICAAMVLPSGS